MVSIERQAMIALNLADSSPNARVLLVCSRSQQKNFVEAAIRERDGKYNVCTSTYTSKVGGTVIFRFLNSDAVEQFAGIQLTHVILNESVPIEPRDIDFLRSRLRSTTYKEPLEMYFPSGLAVSYRSYG